MQRFFVSGLSAAISVSLLMAGCAARVSPARMPARDYASAMEKTSADGPTAVKAPAALAKGDATAGRAVFRFETFGNEGFWTDAARLAEGIRQAHVTLLDALKLGMTIDVERIDPAMRTQLAAEVKSDHSAARAPLLNDPAVMTRLLQANAVVGVVPKQGKLGISCALCHTITDGSLYAMANGGSIGHRIDGRTEHTLQIGKLLATAANSRAFYPNLQLQMADGSTIGRAPHGLTKDSTEAQVDAYLSNPEYFPVGMFDDTPDGIGSPMHVPPLFRQDLAAPYGTSGQNDKLDNFSNTVYTALLDPTGLLTPGGRKFLEIVAGKGGTQIADDYAAVLKSTGATGYPYVRFSTTGKPGDPATPVGVRVDNAKLLDLNAYLASLPAPAGVTTDVASGARGRGIFRSNCTSCHSVDQGVPVNAALVPMNTIWPGYAPKVLAQRMAPLDPIQNSPGTFDDKMIVVDASLIGGMRGAALPLLLDLARKPVFLHDDSVPSLDALLDPQRGPQSPHPFYIAEAGQRADVIEFLRELDTQESVARKK